MIKSILDFRYEIDMSITEKFSFCGDAAYVELLIKSRDFELTLLLDLYDYEILKGNNGENNQIKK